MPEIPTEIEKAIARVTKRHSQSDSVSSQLRKLFINLSEKKEDIGDIEYLIESITIDTEEE